MHSGFEVIQSGIQTLIQDKGRFGFNDIGVTTSGVMDEYAYFWANKLLGNKLEENVLEILIGQLKLKATADITISITGANLSFCINDKPYLPWQTFLIKKGDILSFNKRISGQRAYLSVKGGFNLEPEFGSFSTSIKESLGGFNGNALKNGDFLPFESSYSASTKRLQQGQIPDYEDSLVLRVLLGYQHEHFSKKQIDKFFSSTFRVTQENNRMAIKLSGESITPNITGIISEGICFGAIQIPKDGQPIILLKERQTIGGYPKIGSVLNIDCFKLSQLKINTTVNFQAIELKEAQSKMKAFYRQFQD